MEVSEQGFVQVLTDLTAQKVTIVDVPRLSPLPVWDEHLADLSTAVGEKFTCESEQDLNRAKSLREQASNLKRQIEDGYSEVTREIDAIKAPILSQKARDLASVGNIIARLDDPTKAFLRAEQARADAKARADAEERNRVALEAQRAEAEMLKEWGDEKGAEEVAQAPIPTAAPEPVKTGFTYAKGVGTRLKLAHTIVKPDAVVRAYCAPVDTLIKAELTSYFRSIDKPTAAQIAEFEEKVGGIKLEWK